MWGTAGNDQVDPLQTKTARQVKPTGRLPIRELRGLIQKTSEFCGYPSNFLWTLKKLENARE
jgi:hypothetical protein